MRHFNLNDFEITIISRDITIGELGSFLFEKKRKWFCSHDWVYWKFSKVTKVHRVCKKCNKKQQNNNVVGSTNIWRKDTHFK